MAKPVKYFWSRFLAKLGKRVAEQEGRVSDLVADPRGGIGGAGEGVGGALVANSEDRLDRPFTEVVAVNLVVERDQYSNQFAASEQDQRVASGAVGPDPGLIN